MLGVKRELLLPVSAVFLVVAVYTSLTLYASLGLHPVRPGPSSSHSQDALMLWNQSAIRSSFSPDCHPASAPVINFLAGSTSGGSRQVSESPALTALYFNS